MRPRFEKLAGVALCCGFAACWVSACDDGGTTTSCEEMPIADEDEDVPSRDPAVRAWWDEAIESHCATPPLGDSGAAGAQN